jgi:hypothetical protein
MATKANSKVKAATVAAPTAPATPFSGLLAAPSGPVKAQVAKQPKTAAMRVVMGPKPYRVACEHNNAWWATIGKALAQGPATVAQVVQAGVPSHFVGYVVRKGYLVAATE